MKVLVGMSGGVDSSTTAYLLKKAGYEVEGLSLRLFEARDRQSPTTCCSLLALEGAEQTAAHLGIRHEILDVRNEFIEKVVEPFVDAYTGGLTPNPCIMCNESIKFPLLLKEARARGAGLIATGHYSRVIHDGDTHTLKKGLDPKKDQSYFLYVLSPEALSRLVLPLGDRTKDEVRQIAQQAGLPASTRPESQEICFVEDNDYGRFIRTLRPDALRPGPIKDSGGNVVGMHEGIHHYTIGQRKRLNIPGPKPLYVIRIDAAEHTVIVGPKDATLTESFTVEDLRFLSRTGREFETAVKVRSMMQPADATVLLRDDGTALVRYHQPSDIPAPGQAAVFYDGDTVVGGGVIRTS